MINKKFMVISTVLILFSLTSLSSMQAQQNKENPKMEKITVGPLYVKVDKIPEINRESALAKADQIMKNINLIPGKLIDAKLLKDTIKNKDKWIVEFEGSKVEINPVIGELEFLSFNLPSREKATIIDKVKAEGVAKEIYAKLRQPLDYKLVELNMNGDDYWFACWKKEISKDVFSDYQAVKMFFVADTGELKNVCIFNETYDIGSNTVEVTKDQAISVAVLEVQAKGFNVLLDAKLKVVKPNYFWVDGGTYKQLDVTRLAWVVKIKNNLYEIGEVYIDVVNGKVIGGDKSKGSILN